jgi:hypothetical protein
MGATDAGDQRWRRLTLRDIGIQAKTTVGVRISANRPKSSAPPVGASWMIRVQVVRLPRASSAMAARPTSLSLAR